MPTSVVDAVVVTILPASGATRDRSIVVALEANQPTGAVAVPVAVAFAQPEREAWVLPTICERI